VYTLRRVEGGFGRAFWADGWVGARKRCGDGFCVGILYASSGPVYRNAMV
jgi:hypothetical protein